jgi:hypothetical protein
MTRSRRRVHLVIYGLAFALAALAVPVLSMVGVQALLDSRDGEVIDPVLDPTAPGYQALVSPSPTMVVVHNDPDGRLVGVAVLGLAGDSEDATGGSVMLLPPSTIVSMPDLGDLTLEYVQHVNGTESTHHLTEWVLGMGSYEMAEITDGGWADLVAPVGSITVTNPDEVTASDGTQFPVGQLNLAPEQVGPYLSALDPGENPLNRLLRQELVWSAWLRALGEQPDAAFGGEQDRGLARFAPAIANGVRRIEVLPIAGAVEPGDPDGTLLFTPDDDAIAELIPEIIPFPAGARPGQRPLVRLLDGSERADLLPVATRQVAIAGGQVVMLGNADEFGRSNTVVRFAEPELEAFARAVAAELGVGTLESIEHIDDNAELVIVLGTDYQG